MSYNIFQGNKQLMDVVLNSLDIKENKDLACFSTKDMYFETFFYLSKRFGQTKILDEDKDGGNWDFKVKDYTIRIELNSNRVSFIVFGKYRLRNELNNNPYWVKLYRETLKKSDLLLNNIFDDSKWSDYERAKLNELINEFQIEKNIPDNITPDEFNDKYGLEFWDKRIGEFNKEILDISFDKYQEYGEYSNAKTRHALKTLEQFIKNMLTPTYVRDCSFNIKGRISDEDSRNLERYTNNIKIEFLK